MQFNRIISSRIVALHDDVCSVQQQPDLLRESIPSAAAFCQQQCDLSKQQGILSFLLSHVDSCGGQAWASIILNYALVYCNFPPFGTERNHSKQQLAKLGNKYEQY